MADRNRRLQRGTALVVAICASALIAAAGYVPILQLLLGVLAGLATGIVFHELGHLAFAVIGSISVYRIYVGGGPQLWRSRRKRKRFKKRKPGRRVGLLVPMG